MTIADKLTLLANTKTAIAQAIEDKGVTVGEIPFSQYPDKIAEISGGGAPEEWVRPADWLPMPSMSDTDQAFYGLVAVFPNDSNFLALTASGDYTVEWGDGTITNHASNTTAEYLYDYNAAGLDGTECSRGYKQAMVKVTPQEGSNLTALSLNVRHSSMGGNQYTAGWLDILCGSPNFSTTGLVIGQTSATETVRKNFIERVRILNLGNTTTFASRFQNLRALRVIELPDTSAVTNMSSMFNGCNSLQTVPLFNTQSVATMSTMFSGCSSLQTVPLFNTQSVTNMSSMFSSCSSLQTVPLFNTQSVTTMGSMFQNCSSLQTVPLFNTQNVTAMATMFNGCSSLQTVPLFNTQNVTNMNSMFSGCSSLTSVPALNTTAVPSSTNFNSVFANCNNLARIEAKDFRFTFSVANCKLSAAALDEIYTNLPTVTGQTITVTGNWGTATDDPTIATAKGWTVTG
jgi:surface protein